MKIDMVGKRYNRWTVIEEVGKDEDRNITYLCECECGSKKILSGRQVRRGNSKSCGCLNDEKRIKHSLAYTRAYNAWQKMKSRCENTNDKQYGRYGGRGITICDRWQDVQKFYEDMNECPDNFQIDRIDNDGNYQPNNCRWVEQTINAQNKSTSKWWYIDGVKYESSYDASKELGVSQTTIINWCDGYLSKWKNWIPPKENCYVELKYGGNK